MSEDKIDKISAIGKATKAAGADLEGPLGPNRAAFEAAMKQDQVVHVDTTAHIDNNTPRLSPIEEAHNSNNKITLNKNDHQELISQLDDTIQRIDNVKEKLTTTNDLQLRSSVQTVMRKKLEHIDQSLKSALSRVGSEFDSAAAKSKDLPSTGILGPVERFIGMLSQGQHELYNLSGNIHALSESKQLSPASLLAIQIKVNMVQQQVELFTALLNKALESTKTIMNVQV
jgi:hypothetical protein